MVMLSLIVALCWTVPFMLGGHLRLGASPSRRAWLSAAGGTAIAYVFVDLLPEMQRMQGIFSEASAGRPFPFPHYRVYSSALIGFVFFYALENLAVRTRPAQVEGAERRRTDRRWSTGFTSAGSPSTALMAYLLRGRRRPGAGDGALRGRDVLSLLARGSCVAEEHGPRYDRSGRWLMSADPQDGWSRAARHLRPRPADARASSWRRRHPTASRGNCRRKATRELAFRRGAFGYALVLLMFG